MTRTVSLVAQIPDDSEDLDGGGEFVFSLRADGVDPDTVAPILLAGVDALVRQMIRQEMEAENPMGNAEFMDGMARAEARLFVMDMVVHLPDRGQRGIITQV